MKIANELDTWPGVHSEQRADGAAVIRYSVQSIWSAAQLRLLKRAAANAWTNDVPTVLEVSVSGQVPPLV